MLIGISGKMGAGKNLVCTIIQGLTAAKKHNIENPSFEWIKKYYINSIWEQKAFAGKLKQTASLLTGIPVEKFEDQEFKNTELPEEWWYTYGKIGNKDILVPYLDMDKEFKNNSNSFIEKLTPRELLQIIGTDCIRDKVHPNAWVNALFAAYKLKDGDISNSPYSSNKMNNALKALKSSYPNWVITDMRFPNELEAVKSRGGITIRVNRPYDSLNQDSLFSLQKQQETNNHPSETALDSATFDFVISNDKDIEHLINEVRKILEKLNIV